MKYLVEIAKNSHTVVLSEETKRMVCDEFCHHLTTGECQHPNLGDDNCYMKLANNGTCPAGTVECGMRPAKKVPTGTPGAPTAEGGRTYLDVPGGLLQENTLIANDVSLPALFKLGFKLTPRSIVSGGLGNIVHFSKNDDQNFYKPGEAIPAIYFLPSSFDLICFYGTFTVHTSGTSGMVADVEYDLEFRLMEAGAQIFVNGAIIAEEDWYGGSPGEAFDNVRVWAAGDVVLQRGISVAEAEISGLWFSNLSGDEEYPLIHNRVIYQEYHVR